MDKDVAVRVFSNTLEFHGSYVAQHDGYNCVGCGASLGQDNQVNALRIHQAEMLVVAANTLKL